MTLHNPHGMVNEIRRLFNSTPQKLQKCALQPIGTLIAKRGAEEEQGMKKGLLAIICLLALSFSAIPVGAQTRLRRSDSRRYEQRYDGRRNRDWNRDRSVWDRHRDKITTAAGAGGGALLGAAIGGKKGAIIGAIVGGGGAALYTYGIRDKDRDNRYRYRNRRY